MSAIFKVRNGAPFDGIMWSFHLNGVSTKKILATATQKFVAQEYEAPSPLKTL
jgi:hypothetical protein